eukprot:TRINITY_DN13565_c0_g1_i2.p1 TRINITY_DN13565_c0_g1~~TRINITY_DN13565_c0_g1_i2.p1  ORF type:complete len:108 (+),score=6.16 TRINITY_DN13565_c0_g1_i2:260-583(+)
MQLKSRLENLQDIPLDLSRSLHTLSILDLDFSQTQISNTSIASLFRNISFLTNLNQLRLNFKGCENIKSVGFDLLKSSASLRELRLSFRGNNQIMEGMRNSAELCST